MWWGDFACENLVPKRQDYRRTLGAWAPGAIALDPHERHAHDGGGGLEAIRFTGR
jgi:hypothetical protein